MMVAVRTRIVHIPEPIPLGWTLRPADVIDAWPADRPICALVSGSPAHESRWSIIAAPVAASDDGPGAHADPLAPLGGAAGDAAPMDPDAPPFHGGWIGWLGYELGRLIEPAAAAADGRHPVNDRGWPAMRLLRCPGAYVHDALSGRWWITGDGSALPAIDPARVAVVDRGAFIAGALRSASGREVYERSVADVIGRIGAGDVFQVNLSHRLSCEFAGSPRTLFGRLLEATGAWRAALIEDMAPGRAVLSVSPELFFDFDARSRRVVTRPIKGTRPGNADPRELIESEKDAAELVMIVDLMRNDIGRVCEPGSVRVDEARTIERHGGVGALADAGVLHGVATVSGRVREGLTAADIVRAAFPAGSITGAPKIKAMQIIEELEPTARGPYCGSVGFVSDCGRSVFNVAIRTGAIAGESESGLYDGVRGALDYPVGAGIVADSDPAMEWRETLAKAAAFSRIVEAAAAPARAGV
ncbi:MAG: anthranilate synthase component I family protein [Phycisphaeraceae bacterium]|nr:MAG: anthranilate synthase component I family protein [Phycisphaeraceae bacterium]